MEESNETGWVLVLFTVFIKACEAVGRWRERKLQKQQAEANRSTTCYLGEVVGSKVPEISPV